MISLFFTLHASSNEVPCPAVSGEYMPGGAGLWHNYKKNLGSWQNYQTTTISYSADGEEPHTYTGSFCPWKKGRNKYNFSWKGNASSPYRIWLSIDLNHEDGTYSSGELMDAKLNIELFDIPMLYGKCYQIRLWRNKQSVSPKHFFYVNPVDEPGVWYKEPHSVAGYYGDECLTDDFRYGLDCQSIANMNCHGRGHYSLGINGTGRCICDPGYQSDPFCDPDSKPPGNLAYSVYESPSEDKLLFDQVFNTSTPIAIIDPYARIIIKGKINLPQPSVYEFRINNSPLPAQLTIEQQSTTEIGTYVNCKDLHSTSSLARTTLVPDTPVVFSIKLNTGCPFPLSGFDLNALEWKFYAKGEASGSASQWIPIPKGYFDVE